MGQSGELSVLRWQMPSKFLFTIPRLNSGSLVVMPDGDVQTLVSEPKFWTLWLTEGGGFTSLYLDAVAGAPLCTLKTEQIPALVAMLSAVALNRCRDMALTKDVPPKPLVDLAKGVLK